MLGVELISNINVFVDFYSLKIRFVWKTKISFYKRKSALNSERWRTFICISYKLCSIFGKFERIMKGNKI